MARKFRPACNHMNGGSALRCSQCDREFDPATVVAPGRLKSATRACPQCQRENPPLLETCACGYRFKDVGELREQLEDQGRAGMSYIVIGALGVAGCTAVVVLSSATLLIAYPGFAVLIAKGIRVRSAARRALTEITAAAGPSPALPTAKVVR